MKVKRLFAPSLVLASLPLALALHPRGDAPGFEPKAGSKLSKELAIDLSFHLEDLSVSVNGQELPSEMLGGDMDEAILVNALMNVTEEFVASQRGKPLELVRSYEKLKLEGGPENETESMDEIGDFEGKSVRFKWNEDDSEYVKSFVDGDGDDSALSELTPDMEFLALLPGGEVDEGATWSASGAGLANVFFPGGLFPLPDAGDDSETAQAIEDELRTQLGEAFKDFEVKCTYSGSREENGRRVGEIALEFDGKASLDLSDLLQTIAELQGGDEQFEADITATADLEFKGEGTLLCDLAAHHVAAFEMGSDITLTADVQADIDAGGQSQSLAVSAEVSGDGKWKLGTSDAD